MLHVPFRHNLWRLHDSRTEYDRYCNYLKSPLFFKFIREICIMIKQRDKMANVDLQKRTSKDNDTTQRTPHHEESQRHAGSK